MEAYNRMLQKDKAEFSRICNRLLAGCFICRANESTRGDYYFILNHKNEYMEYLPIIGYRLEINEEYGVACLTNTENYNRYNMKLFESIILLILRILYDEKKRELSETDEVIVTIGDIHDKYLSLRIRDKMIDKTVLRNAVSTFRRFNIIDTLDRDLGSEESRIIIYDSVLMAVRVEDIQRAYDKLEKYRRGKTADEETDESEAD